MLQKMLFVILLSACSLCRADEASSEVIESVTLSFNPMIGVLGNTTTGTCLAKLPVDLSGCTLRFDYGILNNEVAGGSGTDLYNFFVLSPVNISSAREYTCTVTVLNTMACARNISARTSEPVTLKVKFPSDLITSVSLSSPNTTVIVGSSVNLTCTAILSVDVSGAMIVFDYGFMSNTMAAVAGIIQTNITTISPVDLSPAGDYDCNVTVTAPGVCGGGGSEPACPTDTSKPVPLKVQFPDLEAIDYDISIEANELAVLTCNVTNVLAGTITYQWRRADMSPILAEHSTFVSLFLPYANVSHAGVYICKATISDSTDDPYVIPQSGSLSVTLTVTIPDPNVTGSDVSVNVGSLAALTCNVSNIPNGTVVTYQWKRDGTLLVTLNSTMYLFSSSVDVFDAGVYICEVIVSDSTNNTHVVSGTGSVNVTLTVNITDPIMTGNPVSAVVGSPGVLICNVSNNPNGTYVTYQWKRGSNLLAASEMYHVLSSVNFSDAGVYTCEVNVSASGGSPLVNPATGSESVTLTVTIPDLIVTSNNSSVQVGDLALLTCNVANILPGTTTTYQWRRADMSPISAPHLTGKSLYLPYVNVCDADVYICEVIVSDSTNNPFVMSQSGSVSVMLIVTVPTPAIFRSPNQLTYYPGEYVTLTCVIQDMYMDDQIEYQYQWSFAPEIVEMNGTNFPGPNLTLVPHYNETGDYTCYANTNNTYTIESHGNGTTIKVLSIAMEVQVTSNMDTILDVAPYNNHTLTCTASHKSFANITGNLRFSFDNMQDRLSSEINSSSYPEPYTALTNILESEAGMIQHVCNVTLIVEVPVTSAMNQTIVEVVGGKPPEIPILSPVISSTTNATASWTVPKVIYTPENYTVLYAPHGNCHFIDSNTEGLNRSNTLYTPNNQTLTGFFFEKDVEFSVRLDGLSPSTNYCCVVVASNSHGSTMSKELSFQTETDVIGAAIGGVIAGVVLGLAIFLLLIVWYCLCYKKRYKKFNFGAVGKALDSKISTEKMGAMELKLLEDDSRFQIFNYPTCEAISVNDFPDYVKKKGTEALEAEYEGLQSFDYKSHDVSSIYENRPKDRFQNIYPFDDNRVTLKCLPGDDSSDYINASFVGNYSEGRAYVAAQGPLPNTVDDFWRMVWEYELPTIVMLTQLEESGKEKCACYWPENGSDTKHLDNELELKLVTQTVSPLFVTRKFSLTKMDKDSRSPLSVTQYHFTAWPDHGVPDDKTCITTFISFVRKKHPPSGPPLLVHCSAGVGRTGTFIVLDVMLQRMKEKGTIDIQGYVNQIRTNRVKMVQTALQYVYIHEALSEYLVCGDTSFAIMNARVHMHNMGAVEGGKTGFQKQFELLEELDLIPFDPSMSDGDKYPEKNRYAYNLPYNMNRVRLRVMNNDYINASWVNGYKHRGMFLATQAPLEGTVEDFWRMVWENQSHAIVMLCLTKEGEEEDDKKQMSYQYWPEKVGGKEMFGLYEVTLTSEQSSDDYIIRQLTISKTDNSESTTVTQYHYLKWPEGGKPKVTSSILKMAADLVKTQSSTGNNGITVMCNDGVGRTGAFICIYSQLERIKTVATADVFQCVKSCRLQRAGFVKTLDEFVFCYEVVADYNDDMSLYDNFKYVV